jgi:hypothetical protein
MMVKLCQECGAPIVGRPWWFRHPTMTGDKSYPFCSHRCRECWRLEWKATIAEHLLEKASAELAAAEKEAI